MLQNNDSFIKNLYISNNLVPLHRVFHGIRLLRLMKIGCRETINFFLIEYKAFSNKPLLLLPLSLYSFRKYFKKSIG